MIPSISALVAFAILLIVVGFVVAVIVYLIVSSPMAEPFKGWARWAVIAIGCLIVLFKLLTLFGIST